MAGVAAAPALPALGFRADPDPTGAAIALSWDLADGELDPDAVELLIVRRPRRFPGRSRRGVVPVAATSADRTDGTVVYATGAHAHDFEEVRAEVRDGRRFEVTRQYRRAGAPPDRLLVRVIEREQALDSTDPWRVRVRVIDRLGLAPGTVYYYTAFVGPTALFSRLTQASAPATAARGGRFFRMLPQVDRTRDTALPAPRSTAAADARSGQLERFLAVVEAHADMLESEVGALRDVHAIRNVDSRLLAPLAHQLGWPLKDYLDEEGRRSEIGFAPEFYRTVGTIPNVAAMVNRLTGWDARVRELVRNVLVTWDPTRVEQLDARRAYLDGGFGATDADPPALFPGHAVPRGSVDTSDLQAMFRLQTRAFEDDTAYAYDFGRPGADGYVLDDRVLYNRDTIGVYVVPDVDTETFVLEQTWARIKEIVAEFLPIQVRPVFVLRPGLSVEEAYDATALVTEAAVDVGRLEEAEPYGEGDDTPSDRIPGWIALLANEPTHHSVDTAAVPVEIRHRSWHVWVMPPLP